MSWDIFVQQLPDAATSVDDIPDDFVPGPLGPRDEVITGIHDVFPNVDFSEPTWGQVEEDGFSIEIDIDSRDPVTSFALHVRGDAAGAPAVAALLERLGCRALDPQSPTGIFDAATAPESHARWQRYRKFVVEGEHPD